MSDIWKIRADKSYPEAHNHLLIGKVLSKDNTSVELQCRTFHFSRVLNGEKDIRVGEVAECIIPWSRIEVINVLPTDFDYGLARLTTDGRGNVYLVHKQDRCPIAMAGEPRY